MYVYRRHLQNHVPLPDYLKEAFHNINTIHMRKLLNTLYVTSPGSYLARDGENIVIRVGEEECFRVLCIISKVSYLPDIGCQSGVDRTLCRANVSVSF